MEGLPGAVGMGLSWKEEQGGKQGTEQKKTEKKNRSTTRTISQQFHRGMPTERRKNQRRKKTHWKKRKYI